MMIKYDEETILRITIILIVGVFLIRLPVMCRPRLIELKYLAETDYAKQDHEYRFRIEMIKGGIYRCYIERAPFLFGKNYYRYASNFAEERETGRRYILYNGKITSTEQAKKICARWSNANQTYIDFCRSDHL